MSAAAKPNCMPARIRPTEEDGKRSLVEHAADKAYEARQEHGINLLPGLPLEALDAIIEDRRFVRYPMQLIFNRDPLKEGEFAYLQAVNQGVPNEGFVLFVHPQFEGNDDILPMIVAYHLVCVNYGEIAGPEAAEAFGAALMGMEVEDYYQQLCQIADSLN
ncbi:MAG: hypothetical protein L3J39_11735 [Verrucomicrobiales bacterium]|nr:hypothetical protein [Verrucomicrobiales bacterium]